MNHQTATETKQPAPTLTPMTSSILQHAAINPIREEDGQKEPQGPPMLAPQFGHDFSAVPVQGLLMFSDFNSGALGSSGSGPLSGELHPLGAQALPSLNTESISAAVDQGRKDSGTGIPLATEDQISMEQSLGLDLSQVRIHVDRGAKDVTETLGARAATIGHDIYVSPQEYQPGTTEWKRLLGHELTHVAQTGGRESSGPFVGASDSEYEKQAEQVAHAVVTGEHVAINQVSTAPRVQRLPRPLPTDTVAMTFPSPLDPRPVQDWCRVHAGRTERGSGTSVWDNIGLDGQVATIFQSGYFSQRNTSWSSGEATWDPGFLYPNISVQVTIQLYEDQVQEQGAGTGATVGSTSGTTASTGTSTQRQTGASGGGTGGVKDQAQASGTGSSQTTTSSTGSVGLGGSATGQQGSDTRVYTSNVYARVTIHVRSWDIFTTYSNWTRSTTVSVGTARYTRPTLAAPPTAPAGAPTR